MDAPSYIGILEQTLIPFINDVMQESHKVMADNDPKHTSRLAKQFIEEKGKNWRRTPTESLDLNHYINTSSLKFKDILTILPNPEDLRNNKNALDIMLGKDAIFLPKFYCGFNGVERGWGHSKHTVHQGRRSRGGRGGNCPPPT